MINIPEVEKLARAAIPASLMTQAEFRGAANQSAVLEMTQLIRELAGALDRMVNAAELPGDHCELEQALPGAIEALEKARQAGVTDHIEDVRHMVGTTEQSSAVAVPDGWREMFSELVYDKLAAADNQDVPLEEYPGLILAVLDSVVGPRHPEVVKWRNDAIDASAKIAERYGYGHVAQDIRAMVSSAPKQEGV